MIVNGVFVPEYLGYLYISITTSRLTLSTIYPRCLGDRFGLSLRFCRRLECVIRKPFLVVRGVKMDAIGGGFCLL